jgi:hypothetical protein
MNQHRNHLPSLEAMARIVAPTLGGLLLGGLFVPPAPLGSILGAVALAQTPIGLRPPAA